MTLKAILVITSLVLLNSVALAKFQTTLYPINEIVDVTVDRDKNLKLITHVVYPNGCFNPENTIGVLDESFNTIKLFHSANIDSGMCAQAVVPKYPLVEMKKPHPGVYRVIDASYSRHLGNLNVGDGEVTFIETTDYD